MENVTTEILKTQCMKQYIRNRWKELNELEDKAEDITENAAQRDKKNIWKWGEETWKIEWEGLAHL